MSTTEKNNSAYRKYHLEISEPTLIAQGDYKSEDMWKTWGYMQFPNVCRTADNKIVISWALRPDTIDASEEAIGNTAVSLDNGETWRPMKDEYVSVRGVKMPNGKIYQGFFGDTVFVEPALNNYTPALDITRRRVKLHYAENIKEITHECKIVVYDPDTKTVSHEPAKVNWPYMPVQEFSGNRVFPTSRSFSYMNAIGFTVSGNSLYHCLYSYGFDSKTGALCKHPDCFNVYVFRSDDCGATWNYVSQFNPPDEIYDANDINAEGWGEPAILARPDGSFLVLLRSGSGRPSYIFHSTDECKTWSEPVMFDKVGVYPHILELDCGVTVASYGRPGVFVRATNDPAAVKWDNSIRIELSPCPSPDPFLHDTCAYTDMIALDDHSLLLVYSDFNWPNENGEPRKAIIARKITVVADV